jgi:hypothetical protein
VLHILDLIEQSPSRSSHFTAEEIPQYSLNKRLDGTQSQSGWVEKRKVAIGLSQSFY